MSTHERRTGNEPELRWVVAGRRTRRSLVRRLSLSFELRRQEGERQGELWIYAEDCIYRWRVSARGLEALDGEHGLAAELQPLATWAPLRGALPRWDQGRCVIEASSLGRLHATMERGPLRFALYGERVSGEFGLERTPLSFQGHPQWVIRREEAADAAERRV